MTLRARPAFVLISEPNWRAHYFYNIAIRDNSWRISHHTLSPPLHRLVEVEYRLRYGVSDINGRYLKENPHDRDTIPVIPDTAPETIVVWKHA